MNIDSLEVIMSQVDSSIPFDAGKSPDPVAAAQLCAVMSAISECYYCAGWLIGLEESLWGMLHGGSLEFGLGKVEDDELALLRELHEKCGGWIRWRDGKKPSEGGEEWIPTAVWVAAYDGTGVKGGPVTDESIESAR